MIKKLRFKFIAVSTVSLFIVLSLIVGAANLISYRQIVRDSDSLLDELAAGGGDFTPFDRDAYAESNISSSRGQRRRPGRGRNAYSVEVPFESRYFSVSFQDSGETDRVSLTRIAAVNEEEAVEYAKQAIGGRQRGFLKDYRYLVTENDAGRPLVIFLDRGRSLETFRSFLFASLIISLLGLLAVLILVSILSERVTRPFLENYEKQRRFITDAGHELKTPLAIIEADADVLEMDLGENEWLEDIHRQTARLSELTRNLITLARSEEGGGQYVMIDFPLSEVVSEICESYRGPAKARQIEYSEEIAPLLTICGDQQAIRQLISILLDNALKYTPESGRISVTLQAQGKTGSLTVFNTAESVPRGSISHLFERFYRADSSRSSGVSGYGIGLSIAQAIVTAHRGRISARTDDERSLTITVKFPLVL